MCIIHPCESNAGYCIPIFSLLYEKGNINHANVYNSSTFTIHPVLCRRIDLKNVLWVGKGSLIFGELRRYVCRTIIFEKDLKL